MELMFRQAKKQVALLASVPFAVLTIGPSPLAAQLMMWGNFKPPAYIVIDPEPAKGFKKNKRRPDDVWLLEPWREDRPAWEAKSRQRQSKAKTKADKRSAKKTDKAIE